MLRLIYTSVQSKGFDKVAFGQLCEDASRKNSTRSVGGLLLYNDLEFMQCLEGPSDDVIAIYKKIVVDPRHFDIRLLVSETTDSRLFETWSMLGLVIRPQSALSSEPAAYTLLDHRLYRPWKALGQGAADLIYEYAKVKSELEKTGDVGLLGKVFEVY